MTEHEALSRFLQEMLSEGWPVQAINDGDGWVDDRKAGKLFTHDTIMAMATGVDECHIRFEDYHHNRGVVHLVYGNSPIELVANYTDSLGFGEAVEKVLHAIWPHYPDEG